MKIEKYIDKAYRKYKKRRSYKNRKELVDDFFNNDPKALDILSRNERFRNAYTGKRCFVLGNGPSLKEIDLAILRNEYTFTVNQIARRDDFPQLHTNFHFWADPAFFRIDPEKPEDLELLDTMKSVDTEDNHPFVFFPYNQIDFAEKFNLIKNLNLFYFVSDVQIPLEETDYTHMVPSFDTVVQWCITMAIYMGFSEIYLLGCDNTSIINNIYSAADQKAEEYGYTVSENEQKRMKSLLSYHSLYDYVYSYLRVLSDYKKLNDFCEKNNISLINCTTNSAIDSIPKKDLACII